ncbi:hypothetical protein ACI2LF_24675 [Kribbella sp. NPDC020789]
MGEPTPADWTAEFERAGRVEFPLRRGAFAVRSVPFLVMVLPVIIWSAILTGQGAPTAWLPGAFGVFGFTVGAAGTVWQLVTRRPVLIVDGGGIQLSRRSIPWSAFAKAGPAAGRAWFRYVTLEAVPGRARNLRIGVATVQDLGAFSEWVNSIRPAEQESHVDPA